MYLSYLLNSMRHSSVYKQKRSWKRSSLSITVIPVKWNWTNSYKVFTSFIEIDNLFHLSDLFFMYFMISIDSHKVKYIWRFYFANGNLFESHFGFSSLTVRACVWSVDSRVVGYRYALVLDLDKSHQPLKLDILTIMNCKFFFWVCNINQKGMKKCVVFCLVALRHFWVLVKMS